MADLAVEILKEIRDEIRHTNQGIDQTNQRLDQTNEKMERLERRQTEMEVRLATELVAVVSAVHELRDAILEDRKLREAVADHEARIRILERKSA